MMCTVPRALFIGAGTWVVHQEAEIPPIWWCQPLVTIGAEVSRPAQIFPPGLFNILSQGTGKAKKGP